MTGTGQRLVPVLTNKPRAVGPHTGLRQVSVSQASIQKRRSVCVA